MPEIPNSKINSCQHPYYSAKSVKHGVVHFVTGRVTSACLSFIIMVLLVQEMPTDAYALYVLLFGFTALAGIVTSFALEHAAQRFIPELLSQGNLKSAYSLFWRLLLVRFLFTMFGLWIVTQLAHTIEPYYPALINIHNVLYLWTVVTFFTIMARSSLTFMEIFLLQRAIKWLNIVLASMRLVFLLIVFYLSKSLPLSTVLWVDGLAHTFILFCALIYLAKKTYEVNSNISSSPLLSDKQFWKRIWSYLKFSSLRELLFLFSAPAANRVVMGRSSFGVEMAAYGFAQSLSDFVERYMPSVFLWNIIKPTVMGKFSEDRCYQKVSLYSNFIFKINLFFLLPFVLLFAISGAELSILLTKGKYPDSAQYLVGLILILVLRGHYYFLDLHASAAEKMGSLFVASILASLWIIPAFLLVPYLGIWGLVVSRIVTMIIRDLYVTFSLISHGIPYRLDYTGIIKLLMAALVAYVIGAGIKFMLSENIIFVLIAAFASLISFLVIVYFLSPFKNEERDIANSFIGRRIFIF